LELSSFVGPDPSQHIGTTEVEGPSASKRCSVLNQHNLLINSKSLQDLLGLDESPSDVLLTARWVRRMRVVVSARGRSRALRERVAQSRELTASSRQHLGRVEILDGGKALQIRGIKPGPLPRFSESAPQLSERLIEKTEIDPVFAPASRAISSALM
jgi:hypothetical protein